MVAIYRGPRKIAVATCCTRSLRLGRTLRRVLAGHSGPVREARVSGDILASLRFRYCVLSHLATTRRKSPAGYSGRRTPHTPASTTKVSKRLGKSFLGIPHKCCKMGRLVYKFV